jgi:hypothetical protein
MNFLLLIGVLFQAGVILFLQLEDGVHDDVEVVLECMKCDLRRSGFVESLHR